MFIKLKNNKMITKKKKDGASLCKGCKYEDKECWKIVKCLTEEEFYLKEKGSF